MTRTDRTQEVARRVRMARAGAQLSLREMAQEVSRRYDRPVSHDLVMRIEKGRKSPDIEMLHVIAEVTDTDLSWILAIPGQFKEVIDISGPAGDNLKPIRGQRHFSLVAAA